MFRTNFNSKEKIWSRSDLPTVYNTNASLGRIVLHHLKLFPNKISQISANNEMKLTCKEIYDQTVRIAQNLQYYNFEKGDVFSVISLNNHELAPIIFAGLCLGNPVNTLDTSFSEAEITHMLEITKPKAVFCEINIVEKVKRSLFKLNNNANIFTFGGSIIGTVSVSELSIPTEYENDFIPENSDAKNEIAFILGSSGRTGYPKAVCLSHASFLERITAWSLYTFDDISLCFSSLYWLSGIATLIMPTISGCTRIITTETFSPELFLNLTEKYRATNIIIATFQLISVLKCKSISNKDLSSLKIVQVGGSKVPYKTTIQLSKYAPNSMTCVGYGMSETCGLISMNYPPLWNDAVGRLSSGCQVKIIDENGKRLGVNENGEIFVKSLIRFYGYYNNPEATMDLFDEEGFIRTGDIGRFDDNGNLYFVDRKKDILRYKGFMISPTEIEDVLISTPGIKAVCVCGVDDSESSDLPAAAIVQSENLYLTESYIHNVIAEQFSDSKKLRGGIYFVESLPFNSSGQIDRKEVKHMVNEFYRMKMDT